MKNVLGSTLLAIAVLVIVMSSRSVFGLLTTPLTVGSGGSIKREERGIKTVDVAAYSDSGCTSKVSSINWGTVEPGSSNNVIIYLKNEGNTPLRLSLSTANWNPASAASYMSISWNYSGAKVASGSVIQVTLTLKVSSSISGVSNFTVDIVITVTG